jgi:ADP-dependent NAD(P)H-hydrate dehydratase / NAD(P)H-hydrate epimerase
MKIVTAAEMREIDRVTSARFGVPSLTLMENAGTAVAEFVLSQYPSAKRIGVICGKGNNGGDGFVVARKLHESGKEVGVTLLASTSELRGDTAEMFAKLPLRAISITSKDELKRGPASDVLKTDILIDAILGTGFRPPVSGLYAEAVAALNASAAAIVSVDIPSGADADVMGEQTGAVARSDAIVTFTAPRPAHIFGLLASGPILVSPIGSPEEAIISSLSLNVITPRDVVSLFGPRPPTSNKGNFGHVLVLGGSLGKAGAPAMAGIAALRAGAGLSTVATAKSVVHTVAGFYPELMTEPLEQTEEGTISGKVSAQRHIVVLFQGKTVLAVGPGVSRNPETAKLVRSLVSKCDLPMVLDADGLNAFEGYAAELSGKGRSLVITPHPGEMARLVGSSVAAVQRDRLNVARTFAREHGVIVVLKGHRTVIAEPDGVVWVNTTGNPGMATGGTGDILTGLLAGLIAQNRDRIVEAVIAAVHLHGLAGDVACETMGEQLLVATDLLAALPEAFRRVKKAAQEKFVRIG